MSQDRLLQRRDTQPDAEPFAMREEVPEQKNCEYTQGLCDCCTTAIDNCMRSFGIAWCSWQEPPLPLWVAGGCCLGLPCCVHAAVITAASVSVGVGSVVAMPFTLFADGASAAKRAWERQNAVDAAPPRRQVMG